MTCVARACLFALCVSVCTTSEVPEPEPDQEDGYRTTTAPEPEPDQEDQEVATTNTTTLPQHWLEYGCSVYPARKRFPHYGQPRFADDVEAAGQVVCCSDDGASSTRKRMNGQCLGSADARKVSGKKTFAQALSICKGLGMRLCSGSSELDLSCRRGCRYDNALVWTSNSRGIQESTTTTTTTFLSKHWLEDGCSKNSPSHRFRHYGQPRFADDVEAAGEVVCCYFDGASSIRKRQNGQCLGSAHAREGTGKKTFAQALSICNARGMRLCSGSSELDLSCGDGCGYDNALVWTSEQITATDGVGRRLSQAIIV